MKPQFPHHWRALSVGLLVAASGSVAHASSDDAWKAHAQAVTQACRAASGLKNVRPVGQAVTFSDENGMTAQLQSGRYPQPHMKNRLGRELCLYDRKSSKASVQEADRFGR